MQSDNMNGDHMEKVQQSADNNISPFRKLHDTKRFQPCTLTIEYEIYERYFKSGLARNISLIQIGIALLILISQVLTMSMLLRATLTEFWGMGIWCALITITTATKTLSPAKTTTYYKLRTSVVLHLANITVHCFFEMCLQFGTIPFLRRICKMHLSAIDIELRRKLFTHVDKLDDVSVELTANTVSLGLAAFMMLGGSMQILLSSFMTAKSGRAICGGRNPSKEKYYTEIETNIPKESEAVIQFEKKRKDSESTKLFTVSHPLYISDVFPSPKSTSTA